MLVATLARKPLDGTVATTTLDHGTGLILDPCRIGTGEDKGIWPVTGREGRRAYNSANDGSLNKPVETDTSVGRWPANLLLATSEAVLDLDAQSGITRSCQSTIRHQGYESARVTRLLQGVSHPGNQYADTGGASRFFKCVGESTPE